ncbi:MAG: hypothetical protein GF417_13865 [Candidatus Latescibacteria bacterium]|nr:hypothetical protein [bacterium]MBD3425517.1 hypothetical protein [Candidatus Latescibacterota bacterium]
MIILVVTICPLISSAPAASESFGAGIIVGEPTGLSFKNWVSSHTAFAAGAAWSFEKDQALYFHLDYLIHRPGVKRVKKGNWHFFFGLGGRIKLEDDDSRIGARIPLGVNYLFEDADLDFFFEVVPVMDLAPETDFSLNGGFGMRYFFD